MDYDVLRLVLTKDDANQLLREIDILSDSLYRSGDKSYDSIVKTAVRSGSVDLFLAMGATREERKANLQALSIKLKGLTVMKITLAIDPTRELINRIISWIRKEISAEIIIELKTNPAIIGGAIIDHQGKYMDVSLHKKLEEYAII